MTPLLDSTTPAFLFPTVELKFFVTNGNSFDVSLPVINWIVDSVSNQELVLKISVFYNVSLGSGPVRVLLGPGLGLSGVAAPQVSAFSVAVCPTKLGFEYLIDSTHIGIGFEVRPYVSLGVLSSRLFNAPLGLVGVGGTGMLTLNWYFTGH